jgi:hypothetical protein
MLSLRKETCKHTLIMYLYIVSAHSACSVRRKSGIFRNLIMRKKGAIKMLSCLSNVQDLGLFWGSVQVYSGQHIVNIDFQPLALKSHRKEGGILRTEV